MAYAYCGNCGEGMCAPSTREVLGDEWMCLGCRTLKPIDDDPNDLRREAILDLLSRIESLEEQRDG